jgi:hypothetical protein
MDSTIVDKTMHRQRRVLEVWNVSAWQSTMHRQRRVLEVWNESAQLGPYSKNHSIADTPKWSQSRNVRDFVEHQFIRCL